MMNQALSHGAAFHSLERLADLKPDTYLQFSLSEPIVDGSNRHKILELVNAYRGVVKYEPGIDFLPHMETFLRWLAVRYQDAAFRAELSDPAEAWIKDRDFYTPDQEFHEELRRVTALSPEQQKKPENTARLRELEAVSYTHLTLPTKA